MPAGVVPSRARFRPRISLRNLLLLMTCVALAVSIWRTKAKIAPMRAEAARLKQELGYLTVEDPHKIYAIASQTGETLSWKWRIYLPPGRKYRVFCYSGYLPDPQGQILKDWLAATAPLRDAGMSADKIPSVKRYWLDELKRRGKGGEFTTAELTSEFTLRAALVKEGDVWQLRLQPGGSVPIDQPNGDWLSDERLNGSSNSDVAFQDQTAIAADQPLMLFQKRRNVVTESPGGGYSTTSPMGDADGIVLWIEPDAAPYASKQVK